MMPTDLTNTMIMAMVTTMVHIMDMTMTTTPTTMEFTLTESIMDMVMTLDTTAKLLTCMGFLIFQVSLTSLLDSYMVSLVIITLKNYSTASMVPLLC